MEWHMTIKENKNTGLAGGLIDAYNFDMEPWFVNIYT